MNRGHLNRIEQQRNRLTQRDHVIGREGHYGEVAERLFTAIGGYEDSACMIALRHDIDMSGRLMPLLEEKRTPEQRRAQQDILIKTAISDLLKNNGIDSLDHNGTDSMTLDNIQILIDRISKQLKVMHYSAKYAPNGAEGGLVDFSGGDILRR